MDMVVDGRAIILRSCATSTGKRTLAEDTEKADHWYAQGRRAADAGDDALALECYAQAAAREPRNVSLLLEIGNAYARRGETLRAVESYGAALRVDPGAGHVWNNLGNLLLELKGVDAAVSCYENAARLLPSDAIAQYGLGRALNLVGPTARPSALSAKLANSIRSTPIPG